MQVEQLYGSIFNLSRKKRNTKLLTVLCYTNLQYQIAFLAAYHYIYGLMLRAPYFGRSAYKLS